MALTKASTPHIAHIIDPVFYNGSSANSPNGRVEFRLQPGTAYFSDLRLIDVAITSATPTDYNGLLGSESPIKSISIMDGGVTLEALNRAQYLRAWQALQSNNDANVSIARHTSQNSLGYIVQGKLDMSEGTYGEKQDAQILDEINNTVNSAADAYKAWISLRDLFPFLAANPIIPTNIYKDFRVVVQFSTPTEMKTLVANNGLNDLATFRPLLLAEEMTNSELKVASMTQYQGVKWNSWEHDSFRLDALANPPDTTDATAIGDQVSVTRKLRAFTGKYLQEMVIQVTPTNVNTWSNGGTNDLFSKYGSVSLYRPSFNVRINGANKIPREGLIGKNRRLAVCADTLGQWNVPSFQVYTSQVYPDNGITGRLLTTLGDADFTALDIEDYCEDVQLTVRRTPAHDQTKTNQAVDVQVWGNVSKAVVVGKDGAYAIVNTKE